MIPSETVTKGAFLSKPLQLTDFDSGKQVSIDSIISDSPYTLFILNRHYAWPPCNGHMKAVQDSLEEFKQLECKMVVVTSGSREDGLKWSERFPNALPKLLDSEWVLYWKFNLRRYVDILTTQAMSRFVCWKETQRDTITSPWIHVCWWWSLDYGWSCHC